MTDDVEKKPEGIQDVVDNRLDDLFAADDENAGEETEDIQDVVDDRLDDLFAGDDENAGEETEDIQDLVDDRLDDLFAGDDENVGEETEDIQDVVDDRLDDLFAGDDENVGEETEDIRDVVDDRLDDLFAGADKNAGEESEGIQDVVDNRLGDLFPEDVEDAEFAEKDQIIEAHLDDSEEAPEIDKTEPPEKNTAEKKPAGKNSIDVPPAERPDEPETTGASGVDKATSQKASQRAIKAKPVVSEKERKKAGPKQKQNNRGLQKLILGGILIIGGALAFFFFSQSPEPSGQSQPVAAPKTHKIAKLPAKAPETDTAPPVAPPIPLQVTAPLHQPEISSADEKRATPLTPVAVPPADRAEPTQVAVPPADKAEPAQVVTPAVDKAEPAQAATPAPDATSRIKAWLLEWAAAWEKCAGKNGDMAAFMSFYSDDFSSKGFDKNRWHKDKLAKNLRKDWIRIKLDHIKIVGPLGNGRYEARFTQVYQSSNYTDTSKQILILKNETSGWKIIGIKPQTVTRYPFTIHGGSFRNLATAEKAVDGYRKRGLEAYWAQVVLPGKGTWYRVFMGHYTSRESALNTIAARALNDVKPVKTRYANLIGTYSSEDDLQRQRRFIIERGCSPYVILDDNGDFNLYTGAYTSLENAEKYSAFLNSRGIPSQVVER